MIESWESDIFVSLVLLVAQIDAAKEAGMDNAVIEVDDLSVVDARRAIAKARGRRK